MRRASPAAHAERVTAGRTTEHSARALEIACRECGRPIVLVAVAEGTEIADRASFLRVHHDCLVASVPEQRTGPVSPSG